MQPFLRSMKLLRLYTRFMSLCTDLPPKGRDLYRLWAAYPCLSWSAVAMRALTWVVFVPRASFMPTQSSGSSPSPMRQRAGNIVHARRVFMKVFPGNYLSNPGYHLLPFCCHYLQSLPGDSMLESTVLQSISASMIFQYSGINISEKGIVKQSKVDFTNKN